MPSNMFRAKKGGSYKYPQDDDSQTDDLCGFPEYPSEHDEGTLTRSLTLGPCQAYDRDAE